jgi:hypothetical protein
MLDNFIFEDHHGRRFVGRENGVYLNYNDLRDYSWSYDTINGRIARFYQGLTSRTIPLIIHGNTDAEAIAVKNRLMELAESDIESRLPGKIIIGEYYTNGYITESKKKNYLISKRYCEIDLTWVSEKPTWYREQVYKFTTGSDTPTSFGGIDYPYDYSYDYGQRMSGRSIFCDSVGDNAFRIKIYGTAINPTIIIGGHIYSVEGVVGMGENLVIDGLNKTITLTTATGNKVNWFDKRGRENYIFEPIPPGAHMVNYNGTVAFDLTIIEKRREPKWT